MRSSSLSSSRSANHYAESQCEVIMEWNSGQPIAEGYYLCVIIDEHCGPKELFWDGSSWLYPHHNWEPLENNEVAYYLY